MVFLLLKWIGFTESGLVFFHQGLPVNFLMFFTAVWRMSSLSFNYLRQFARSLALLDPGRNAAHFQIIKPSLALALR